MSYKTNTVGGIAPESFSTDFNLTDVADVSGSFSANKTLEYNGSAWVAADMPSSNLGSAGSSFYSFNGSSWRGSGGSSWQYLPDEGSTPPRELMQNAFNSLGARTKLPTGYTQYNWGLYQSWYAGGYPRFSGFFVPAGVYHCRATIPGTPYATGGYAVVRWCTGPSVGTAPTTTNLTQVGPFFYHAITKGRFCQLPTYIIETTATSTLIALEFVEGSSYQYGYNTQWTKYCSYHVTKIG